MRLQQGVPWVRFTMNRQGKVLNAELYRASGHTALDREVVALVKRAEPLPPPPDDVTGDPLTMAVPVAFFIR
jgi:protein TonB